jgi:HupE / UreJ protein
MQITHIQFGAIELEIMAEIRNQSPQTTDGGFVVFIKIVLLFFFLLPLRWLGGSLFAHPMPNSVVVLKIHEKNISGEIQLPLNELQSAIGMKVNDNSERLVERLGDSLKIYLLNHIRPKSFEGKLWKVELGSMKVIETKSKLSGDYKELIVSFLMTPPLHYDLRNFYFDYDVILHQVITHKIMIAVRQDWQRGIVAEDSTQNQIGVIELDIPTGKIPVFQVSLQQGSTWQGFQSMIKLGMKHIAEGSDHLLFLLTLLLPVIQPRKAWLSVLKIVTAFTAGHSLTLILASLKIVELPSQPIEVLIAISILVSAIHVIKPIFTGKEVFIAAGFGLIHGLAFADTLSNLQLDFREMALSIIGFNLGIELMQVCIISAIVPVLIVLAKTKYYTIFRITSAVLAGVMAVFWIVERVNGL